MKRFAEIKKQLGQLFAVDQKKKIISVGVAIAALTLICVYVFVVSHANRSSSGPNVSMPSTPIVTGIRHPLTGQPIDAAVSLPMVYGVMVENSADAWPQAGVDQSFLTIEAPAEGGIPRFLAFFSADQTPVEKIGPVRSARPYFIDWAAAYDPLYAHVGGSPDAMEMLKTGIVYNLDEISNQYQFWRSQARSAPHNVYTSTELLAEGFAKRYPDSPAPSYGVYKFKDDTQTRPEDAQNVFADFGASIYRVRWVYDRETNTYLRFEGSRSALVEDGTQLRGNNIVIIESDMTVLDSVGRLEIRTTGEGKGILAQDGVTMPITWKKDSTKDLLRFYKQDGTEVSFNAGHTWIEVVAELSEDER